MECLNETKLQEYIDGSLTNVEKAMVRDHLIVCEDCRIEYELFSEMEKSLESPLLLEPPEIIERSVLKTLFPMVPNYASISAFIAASFLLLVTGIYTYFGFADNSLVQAYQLTSSSTLNWVGSMIQTISQIVSGMMAVFDAVNRFLSVIFSGQIGTGIIGLSSLMFVMLCIFSISKLVLRKPKTSQQ